MFAIAIKLAVRQFCQQPFSRAFVLISVAFVLVVNGLLFSLFQTFSKSLIELRTVYMMTAYLESSVPATKELEILSAVQKVPTVSQVTLVNKDAFVANFSRYFPQLTKELPNLDSDMIPRYLKIKIEQSYPSEDLPLLQTQLSDIRGIESVELNKNRQQGLKETLIYFRRLSLFLFTGISAVLLCIFLNHYKLGTDFQTQARHVITMPGGRGYQIYLPFLLEGAMEGICAGGLAAIIFLSYEKIFFSQLENFFITIGIELYFTQMTMVALCLVGAGILSGMMGSLWAILRNRT